RFVAGLDGGAFQPGKSAKLLCSWDDRERSPISRSGYGCFYDPAFSDNSNISSDWNSGDSLASGSGVVLRGGGNAAGRATAVWHHGFLDLREIGFRFLGDCIRQQQRIQSRRVHPETADGIAIVCGSVGKRNRDRDSELFSSTNAGFKLGRKFS